MTRATQHFLPTIERIGVNLGNYQDLRRILELCGECDEIAKIDHITFVCAPSERDAFLERWEAKGSLAMAFGRPSDSLLTTSR